MILKKNFWKRAKKKKNWNFGQKCIKFENSLKKSRWKTARIVCMLRDELMKSWRDEIVHMNLLFVKRLFFDFLQQNFIKYSRYTS